MEGFTEVPVPVETAKTKKDRARLQRHEGGFRDDRVVGGDESETE
jgi:hypothetical protein